ncbi:hypothetical protein [Nesterenkonia flava]|uniref:Uncharacterized protein n=1 Tax=Nesterenkonia flava TaxID=469799 RepID=A0ABU1FRW1_9MICC|nr:hypothetical protein [Nesterenkonia flava]MDR5711396.1 hypothetical protein [Nesterenkonia flava]
MSRAWAGVLGREVLPLVAYRYGRGFDLDADFWRPGNVHTVEVAQVLERVPYVRVPDTDARLLEFLRRGGHAGSRRCWWMVARVRDEDRVALLTPAGAVESIGEHLALVESPEEDRYTEVFCLPGLWYMGVRTAREVEEQS